MSTTFKLEHDFPDISLSKFIAHLNDPQLNKMLETGLSFDERKMVKRKELPSGVEWQFHVRKHGELPAAIKRIIKSDGFSWQEKSCFVRAENRVYWEISSDSSLLRFHGEGVWVLSPLGQGCKRIIEGKINVDIPLVGKMVETFIVSELKKTYEIEPSIQARFYSTIA
ncbi:MAG TPA: DUF2505 family protein [Myxococcota bacterium]|nr:DUF2505 family protein [Myxococcota bacterium]